MEKYRPSSHSRYDLKYHFVWITKYRKSIVEPDDNGDNFRITKSCAKDFSP
jgi:REP element-mobilizing transposase RayT